MNLSRWIVPLWLAISPAVLSVALAQQGIPHVGYVYPAGGRQGDTFQILVGGQYLDGVATVYVSGGGVKATVIQHSKPLTQREINELRGKLQELQKKGKDAAVFQEIAGIREKIFTSLRRNVNPVIAEIATLQVVVASDADPGPRELRVLTPLGLSNPLMFCVGQVPEFSESESGSGAPGMGMKITLPATVNGRIMQGDGDWRRFQARPGQQSMPGDVDRYRFEARKDQHLVVAVSARELIPYLADAVPGWFQATVALYDALGNELAYDDDYRFHPDPVLHYVIPRDGEYSVEIKDAIYRGREDFVYRITLGDLPFVTSIFPLGGRAGTLTTVGLKGWNLPGDKLTMDAKEKGPGVHALSVRKGEMIANRVPFAVDALPECLEKEPNNSLKKSQSVTIPLIVNGRIDKPGDWDVFKINARAGDEMVAEVHARRLDSPLDSVLKLTDAKGLQIAYNDDFEDKGSGLNTHHADSLLVFTAPLDGVCYLHLGDAQNKGGVEYAYRLRISSPRPDFELRIVPSGINAGAGSTVPISVYALRKDGFSGDIVLGLKGAPKGYTLSGGVVPAQQDQVRFTLTVPPMPLNEPQALTLEGRATIQAQEVVRQAVPADDMMQAFAYRHLVPAKDLRIAVIRRGGGQAAARIFGEQPVRIPAGGAARIQVGMPAVRFFEKVQFELSEPPEGIAVREVSPRAQGAEIVLACEAAKVKTGMRGNLIIHVSGERAPAPGTEKAQPLRRRIPIGTLPAIPFEIVKP